MIVSTRNSTGGYDYFDVTRISAPSRHAEPDSIGIALQDSLPTLPIGARQVGSGPVVRGTLMGVPENVAGAGLAALIGLVGVFFLFRSGR